MFKNSLFLAFILLYLNIGHDVYGQFAPFGINRVPPRGSVSKAASNAYEREVDLGPVDLSRGVANSRVVTKSQGGFRNGGVTSIANSNAVSRGVNIGGLDIGGTLTRTRTRTNGAVSRGVGYDFNVGNLGLGASFAPSNIRNGFGLMREPDGDVSLGLGFLNLDLSRNALQDNNAYTQAQANAQGKNARTRANSNVKTQNRDFGPVDVTDTFLSSRAVGRTRVGQTNANTAGFANGAFTNGNTFGFGRRRRRSTSVPQRRLTALPQRRYVRPKRQLGIQIEDLNNIETRQKRQFGGFGGFGFRQPYQPPQNDYRRPSYGFSNPAFGFGFRQPYNPVNYNQQSAANTHSNNEQNQNGLFQDNGSSSISSNLAQDGSAGQVSSANTNQMNSITANGIQNSNDAQSQSLNFGPNGNQATNSNAGTTLTQNQQGSNLGANSGSQSTNSNEFGTSSNIANTNSNVYDHGNVQGANADSSSQSIFQGKNGQDASAFTNAETDSKTGPNGFVSNSASSDASATSTGGESASADASASAGSGFGGNNANSIADANTNAGQRYPNVGGFGNIYGFNRYPNTFNNFG